MALRQLCIVALLTLVLSGCGRSLTTPTPAPILPEEEAVSGADGAVVATGVVVPVEQAVLSLTLPGRVLSVAVEGERVEPGAVLLQLEPTLLEADVARAEAVLGVAQAQLALLRAGPRSAEITAAQSEVTAAVAALALAEAQRAQLTTAAVEARVAAARVELAAAESGEVAAQQAYTDVQNDKDAEDWEVEAARLRLIAAEQRRAAAEAQVMVARQAAGADAALAQAAVTQAEAGQAAAEAQLALIAAGATPQDIAGAEAAVAQAVAGLDAAQAALEQAELRAPFAGQVASVAVDGGETVLPGQPVLTLAALDRLQVETTDLSERDVARVAAGQQALVYVEALDTDIEGHVVRIAERASTAGGDVVYTVVIELAGPPEGLRWGMTAEVEIKVE